MKYALSILAITVAVSSMVYANYKICGQQEMFNKKISELKKAIETPIIDNQVY